MTFHNRNRNPNKDESILHRMHVVTSERDSYHVIIVGMCYKSTYSLGFMGTKNLMSYCQFSCLPIIMMHIIVQILSSHQ